MPIKPENLSRYPADWREIRARILARAGGRCEWCGVENGAVGERDHLGEFHVCYPASHEFVPNADDRRRGLVRIVLTIAHVHDPDPANCSDENLAALCQRCHNRHDAPMRRRNASATLAAKRAGGCGRLAMDEERTGREALRVAGGGRAL